MFTFSFSPAKKSNPLKSLEQDMLDRMALYMQQTMMTLFEFELVHYWTSLTRFPISVSVAAKPHSKWHQQNRILFTYCYLCRRSDRSFMKCCVCVWMIHNDIYAYNSGNWLWNGRPRKVENTPTYSIHSFIHSLYELQLHLNEPVMDMAVLNDGIGKFEFPLLVRYSM